MRARTTAAALLGALALVLPTAGTSLAVDHDDDDGRRSLGRLEYLVDDDDEGGDEHRQIRPADNDTCYRLTGTSWENPATTVRNETESLAVLFRDRDCGERAERVLEPGQRVHGVQVRSVLFKPVDDDNEGRHEGRQDGRGDERGDERGDGWGDGRGDGRGDDFGNGDEDRGRHDARPGLPGAPHHNATKPAVRPSVKPRTDEPGSQQARDEQPRDEQAREDQPRDEQARDEQGREDQPREDQPREDQAGDQQARDEQAQREDQARQDQIRREEQARQEEARRDDQARQDQQAGDEQRMRDEQARQEEEQGRPAEQGPDMFDRIFRSIG
ncbi:hypothetical protein [Streptomyces sp. NPDC058279]|uniref:hypothetical protein n=1 Tax=Streptomyces sp. NPDC058279 TaxID=3346418 RepID=UPI0036E6AF99